MMAGRGEPLQGTAGGPARHIPVLLAEVLDTLAPRDGGIYIDGTFGAGGYTRAILDAADCRVIGIDRDPSALAAGRDMAEAYKGRLALVEGRFSELDVIAEGQGVELADGVALDVGVSSMQLDQAERGFSFMQNGPLDMRMGGDGPSAADVVNTMEEGDLANLIFRLGEEKKSRAVAHAIGRARADTPISTTGELAESGARAVGPSPASEVCLGWGGRGYRGPLPPASRRRRRPQTPGYGRSGEFQRVRSGPRPRSRVRSWRRWHQSSRSKPPGPAGSMDRPRRWHRSRPATASVLQRSRRYCGIRRSDFCLRSVQSSPAAPCAHCRVCSRSGTGDGHSHPFGTIRGQTTIVRMRSTEPGSVQRRRANACACVSHE